MNFYNPSWELWLQFNASMPGEEPVGILRTINQIKAVLLSHDDVINWKHFPRYWPFVRGIHRSPVNSPRKGQWREALMFSFICVWINGCVNNRQAGDLRRYRAHYDVTVMIVCQIYLYYRKVRIKFTFVTYVVYTDIRLSGVGVQIDWFYDMLLYVGFITGTHRDYHRMAEAICGS